MKSIVAQHSDGYTLRKWAASSMAEQVTLNH